jgi:adenine-specific DNA-methyltransferase
MPAPAVAAPAVVVHTPRLHHPRRHAAVRTSDYVFSQLIPYLGNKRKLLHLIARAVDFTGVGAGGTFVDLFAGSTVVSRWAKRRGMRVVANDWEPYAHQIALGTVVPNAPPPLAALGGPAAAFAALNALPPVRGYVATHLCPADDERPDVDRERMFFTQANGRRIDAIGEQVDAWARRGAIDAFERAYLTAAFVYAVSYASNTSGVFKGFHRGWGGRTGTALYRIRGTLALAPPVLFDNGLANLALREDARLLAPRLADVCGGEPGGRGGLAAVPDVVYLDPPYNQHPYGSNYHVLNTVALWDKPTVDPGIGTAGPGRDKSAIRKDWRVDRRSPYNSARDALPAFRELLATVAARWVLVSYSTDGNVPLAGLVEALAERGSVTAFAEPYKRYRVSTPRMSPRSHTVEFVAAVDLRGRASTGRAAEIVEAIRRAKDAPSVPSRANS